MKKDKRKPLIIFMKYSMFLRGQNAKKVLHKANTICEHMSNNIKMGCRLDAVNLQFERESLFVYS